MSSALALRRPDAPHLGDSCGRPTPSAAVESAALALPAWEDAFHRALSAGRPADAGQILEANVVRLLGRHEHQAVLRHIDRIPKRLRSTTIRLAAVDARLRSESVDDVVIGELVAASAGCDDQLAFAMACQAANCRRRGEPGCVDIARAGLALLPASGMIEPLALFGRARLRFNLAAGLLMTKGELSRDEALSELDLAKADYNRLGFVEEALGAGAFVMAAFAASSMSRLAEATESVGAAARQLEDRGASFAPLARVSEALLRLLQGDMWSFWQSLEAAESWSGPPEDKVPEFCVLLRLAVDILREDPDVAVRQGEVLAQLAGIAPELDASILRSIAELLFAYGHVAAARVWLDRARASAIVLPADRVLIELLDALLDLGADPLDDRLLRVHHAIEDLESLGLPRPAAIGVARVALVLHQAGRHDTARGWTDQAHAALGDPTTFWEGVMLGRLRDAAAADGHDSEVSREAGAHLRALRGSLSVQTDGEIALGKQHARLVGYLLCQSKPVSIEEMIDVLWPECEVGNARHRLDMALYRLRQLTPGVDLVVRCRNGLRLATIEEGVSTDIGLFLVADIDDPTACDAAVRSYEDDFGATQLATETFAIDTRRWLRARFMLLTTRVLERAHRRGTDANVLDLALRAREAAFEDAQLATAVVAVLANAGRRSDARLLERRLAGS